MCLKIGAGNFSTGSLSDMNQRQDLEVFQERPRPAFQNLTANARARVGVRDLQVARDFN